MNLQNYLVKKSELKAAEPKFRKICFNCRQPDFSCYCAAVHSIDPGVQFVILIHPIEYRRRIATGRMAHLCLKNSFLIEGEDYSQSKIVNSLLTDERNQCFMLYPGKNSFNLTGADMTATEGLFDPKKQVVVFVIDGTWATARKMVRLSQNLASLPKLSFVPKMPSRFRVRKQPAKHCLSTIEAIHEFLTIIGPISHQKIRTNGIENLMHCFDTMVEKQLEFIEKSNFDSRKKSYRKVVETLV